MVRQNMRRWNFMDQVSEEEQVLEFVGRYHGEKGVPPSLADIHRHLGISMRRLYDKFPGGIAEICQLANVPVPEKRLGMVEKAVKARTEKEEVVEVEELPNGQIAARTFELFEEGVPLPQVVIELKIRPEMAGELHEKWIELKAIDINQPAVLRDLGKLEEKMEGLEKVVFSAVLAGYQFRADCRYRTEDGYCKNPALVLRNPPPQVLASLWQKEGDIYRPKAEPSFCAFCPIPILDVVLSILRMRS